MFMFLSVKVIFAFNRTAGLRKNLAYFHMNLSYLRLFGKIWSNIVSYKKQKCPSQKKKITK